VARKMPAYVQLLDARGVDEAPVRGRERVEHRLHQEAEDGPGEHQAGRAEHQHGDDHAEEP